MTERERLLALVKAALELAASTVEDTDVETHSGFYREDDGSGTLRSAAKNVRQLDPTLALNIFESLERTLCPK